MNTEKIKRFFEGRKGLLPRIAAACSGEKDIIWFHVASYGEFCDARPVIEATRKRFPERKILLTVFSPAGYEPLKDYNQVDWVFYLPLDTPRNMQRLVDIVRPAKVIFNIGENWFFLLRELHRRKIDTYYFSVRIEPESSYLRWYGALHRWLFRHCYTSIMVQNKQSLEIFRQMGVTQVKLVGDARLEHVVELSREPWSDALVDAWCGGEKVFVAGNTYSIEHQMLVEVANAHPKGKFMIIPHANIAADVDEILALSQHGAVRYTDYKEADESLRKAQILVVNTVGMLTRLYRYGYAAYVGGGTTGAMPHSVVEPACYRMPVGFGPRYRREPHCRDLAALRAGFPLDGTKELALFYEKASEDAAFRELTGGVAQNYCQASEGATQRIMETIFG